MSNLYKSLSANNAKNLAGRVNASNRMTANGYALEFHHEASTGPPSPTLQLLRNVVSLYVPTTASKGLNNSPSEPVGMTEVNPGLAYAGK